MTSSQPHRDQPRRMMMDPSLDRVPDHELRVGDVERERSCVVLRSHFEAGRLDSAELDERLGRALGARTVAELAALTRDLPPLRTAAPFQAAAPFHATAPFHTTALRPDGSGATPVRTGPSHSGPSLLRTSLYALLGTGVVGAAIMVLLMLVVAAILSPEDLVFCLIGGGLAAFGGAGLTYLTTRPASGAPNHAMPARPDLNPRR